MLDTIPITSSTESPRGMFPVNSASAILALTLCHSPECALEIKINHTVNELAKLSGVTVRTLHYYDAVGLLKPSHVGANGYRYHGRHELLRLQQIMFFRELGMPLAEIGQILDEPGFDQVDALNHHRMKLVQSLRENRTAHRHHRQDFGQSRRSN